VTIEAEAKVGAMLRAAREAKGLTLAKAEQATRIRQKYLAALEDDRSDDLPDPVFVKGFLRNYALLLGLDPQQVIERYRVEHASKKDIPDVQPEIEPLRTPSRLTPAMLTVALAVVVFLLVMYYLYQQMPGTVSLQPTPTIAALVIPTTSTPTVLQPTVVATRVPTVAQTDLAVPDIVGLTLTEANDALERLGLRLEVLERQFSDTVEPSVVISQTVRSQTKVRGGSVVGVVVSKGGQMVSVPRLLGLTYPDAAAKLAAAGLKAQRVEVSAQGTPNAVVGQDPVENAQLAPGSVVRVTVSVGDVVTVPDVRGLPQEQGKDILLKAGLVIGQIAFQGKDKLPTSELIKVCMGCVLSTDPPTGRIVSRGTVVNMGIRAE
jgi:cytoskeleton protein RodZ